MIKKNEDGSYAVSGNMVCLGFAIVVASVIMTLFTIYRCAKVAVRLQKPVHVVVHYEGMPQMPPRDFRAPEITEMYNAAEMHRREPGPMRDEMPHDMAESHDFMRECRDMPCEEMCKNIER